MSGVGSTNAMKKGSGNNPFLAFSAADMRSYLNSAYTGCIVKYTGPSTKREVLTSDKDKDAQNLVFDITIPFTGSMAIQRYAMKIDKATDDGVKTTYICHKWINKLTGRMQRGLGSLDESESWVYALIEIDDINLDNIKGNNVKFLAVTESLSEIPSLIDLHQDWPTTKGINGWQTNCINEAGKITLWSYSEDVKYSYAEGSSVGSDEMIYYEPYVVNELYKVVYGNGRYYFEEYYHISDDVTTATVEDVAPGKTFYDFTGTKQTGAGTKINPYLAKTLDELKSYLTSAYKGAFVKYIGSTVSDTDGIKYYEDSIYQVVDDGTTLTYVILPTLSNPGTAADLAQGKQLIDGDGKVVEGEYDTGLGIVEFLAKTYSGSINDKNGDVTVLYGGQFLSQRYITEVNLPNVSVIGRSVSYLGYSVYARGFTFLGCSSLSKITLSNTISFVGSSNFAYCTNLKSVNFSGVNFVNEGTFISCKALETVNMPDVKHIGGHAFASCSNIKQANFGEIYSVGYYGLAHAFSLDNDISLSFASNSSVTFSQNAMAYCRIKHLYINTTSTVVLSEHAFEYCGLLSDVNITASKLQLYTGGCTFRGCTNLSNVTFNIYESFPLVSSMFTNCENLKWGKLSLAKIKTLYSSVFYGCTKLDYAYLPHLELISGGNTFQYCYSLSYVYMPIVKSISSTNIFTGCSNLKSVYIMQESGLTGAPKLQYSYAFNNTSFNIYVGYEEYVSMLQSANNWSYYSSRIMASQFDSSILLE